MVSSTWVGGNINLLLLTPFKANPKEPSTAGQSPGQMVWESWDTSSLQQIWAHEGTTQQGSVRDLWDFNTAAGLGDCSITFCVPRNEMKTPLRKHLESPQTITSPS